MWTFVIRSGALRNKDGVYVTDAYSGHGPGVNNPDMQAAAGVGPIPVGDYRIGAPFNCFFSSAGNDGRIDASAGLLGVPPGIL